MHSTTRGAAVDARAPNAPSAHEKRVGQRVNPEARHVKHKHEVNAHSSAADRSVATAAGTIAELTMSMEHGTRRGTTDVTCTHIASIAYGRHVSQRLKREAKHVNQAQQAKAVRAART